ncbi:MAG: nucleotide-binding universal stress UspA family protein [Granulosicoccus sp.]|jgi:nucleotide-binding universal stress UspA family protein
MAYQTILTHLSNESVSESVLAAATLLAERHAAHLVGLHIKPPLDLYVGGIVPSPIDFTNQLSARQNVLEEALKTKFETACKYLTSVSEWRSIDAGLTSVVDTLVQHGNSSDLLLLSKTEGDAVNAYFRNLAEHVLTACGRPVLIIPNEDPVLSIGERVFVAWDGRRESTRAVFGALPMLRRASIVRLHRVNQAHPDRHRVVGITEELANTLARHGVSVEVCHSDAHTIEIADELMGYANDMEADVMVMGCFGHSPWREFILGGTTRRLLENSTLPLLMSN